MQKSTHAPHYEAVRQKLIAMRAEAGLTHRELAALLGREHSFVWRIEQGERRLDVVEFHWVCRALGRVPAEVYAELTSSFELMDLRRRHIAPVKHPRGSAPISKLRSRVSKTAFGRRLMSFLGSEDRVVAMSLAADSGKPALAGVLHELEKAFRADLSEHLHRQFVGEAIRLLLEQRGYAVTGKDRKITGQFFKSAALYSRPS